MFSVRGYFEHPDNKERLRDVMCLYFYHENNTIDEAIDLYYKKGIQKPLATSVDNAPNEVVK